MNQRLFCLIGVDQMIFFFQAIVFKGPVISSSGLRIVKKEMLIWNSYPIGSMYISTYIYHKNQPNVGIYAIHGSYGY